MLHRAARKMVREAYPTNASDQVQQREEEDPDEVDEVPVEADVFGVEGVGFAAERGDEKERERDDAADDVEAVHAGEGEVAGEENVFLGAVPDSVVDISGLEGVAAAVILGLGAFGRGFGFSVGASAGFVMLLVAG